MSEWTKYSCKRFIIVYVWMNNGSTTPAAQAPIHTTSNRGRQAVWICLHVILGVIILNILRLRLNYAKSGFKQTVTDGNNQPMCENYYTRFIKCNESAFKTLNRHLKFVSFVYWSTRVSHDYQRSCSGNRQQHDRDQCNFFAVLLSAPVLRGGI